MLIFRFINSNQAQNTICVPKKTLIWFSSDNYGTIFTLLDYLYSCVSYILKILYIIN